MMISFFYLTAFKIQVFHCLNLSSFICKSKHKSFFQNDHKKLKKLLHHRAQECFLFRTAMCVPSLNLRIKWDKN